jgi:hypothetical protein
MLNRFAASIGGLKVLSVNIVEIIYMKLESAEERAGVKQ